MFIGGTIWLLTHGQLPEGSAFFEASEKSEGNQYGFETKLGCFRLLFEAKLGRVKGLKTPVPKWNLGKWKHGPKPAVCPIQSNFEPQPNRGNPGERWIASFLAQPRADAAKEPAHWDQGTIRSGSDSARWAGGCSRIQHDII